jgi:chromosomal replication initiator protein
MQGDKYDAIWHDIWNLVKTYEGIDVSQIDAFFSRVQVQAFSEGFIMLTADTSFIKIWIESHYTEVINRALEELYQVPFNIAIAVDENASSSPPQPPAAPRQDSSDPAEKPAAAPLAPRVPVPEEKAPAVAEDGAGAPFNRSIVSGYTFESFVRGTSNQMAYSMAIAVAETPGSPSLNPLFIYGKSGLGKTHLLRSIQNYIDKTYGSMHTVYVDTMELVNDYTDAAASGSNRAFVKFKNRYESADVLLMDDVQGLQNKKETLNMVFQIVNRMIDQGKQVVLSADRAPKNIDIEERYASRFNSGGTCDIQPPEFETKLGIIRNYVEECRRTAHQDFQLSQEVQEYIAQNSSSNIRELKSAVTKVIFEINNSEKSGITINEVSLLLANHFSGGAMRRPTVGNIQKAVEHYYNITHAELVGKKRSANIASARQIAIYLCRTLIDIPFNTIGTEFNRDHSTVMYSIRIVEEKLKESRELNEEMEILRQMVMEE